jgi:hypothetical protein
MFYPAAIHIGENLKLRLAEDAQAVKVCFGIKTADANRWLAGNYESC